MNTSELEARSLAKTYEMDGIHGMFEVLRNPDGPEAAAALSTLRQRIEALEAENGRLKYAVQDVVRTNTENCRQRDLYQYHLRKAKDRLFNVAEGAVDEGDRAYFRSTNEPADMLEMANALEHLLESDARQALGEG